MSIFAWLLVVALAACAAPDAVGALASTAPRKSAPFQTRNLIENHQKGLKLRVSTTSIDTSGQYVTVSWSGVEDPADTDMVAMYLADRDPSETWPMKYIWTSTVPNAQRRGAGQYFFQVYNYYEPIKFVFLRGAFGDKFIAATSENITSTNPQQPTQVKLAFTEDPSEMRVTWLTQYEGNPIVRYGLSKKDLSHTVTANVSTYTPADLCDAPANSTGWKEPGTINSGVMTGLEPNTRYYYVVGDEGEGPSSKVTSFISAPTPEDTVHLLALADLGQYNEDGSRNFAYWYQYYEPADEFYAIDTMQYTVMHMILAAVNNEAEQDGTVVTYPALHAEARTGKYHSAWHNGDVSYARGAEWQWDTYGHQIEPLTSRIPTMYTMGNHEYDDPNAYESRFSTSVDSGGECGVVQQKRAPMPTVTERDMFYSINHGPIHFLQLNTEANFEPGSAQHDFAVADLAAVNRSVTPWVVAGFHRMMYTDSYYGFTPTSSQVVATDMRAAFEDLFFEYGVDMTWQGHLHNYQRTCPVYNNTCVDYDDEGVARGPIHVTMGHNGFMLTPFYQSETPNAFEGQPTFASFGYCRAEVNRTHFKLQMLDSLHMELRDEFVLYKPEGWQLDREANLQVMASVTPVPFPTLIPISGWGAVVEKIFPLLVMQDLEGALEAFGPSTNIWKVLNGKFRALEGTFMLETVTAIIDFVDARLNATILEAMANGALPAPAEDIMASYDFVASAWKGRIASIVSSEVV
ncbi:hypothetical protein ACKKBF_B32745 [Auxenochlorella protothecoides x Auxenochlorella symbiontica]